MDLSERSTPSLVERVHRLHRVISHHQQELLATLAELDTRQAWEDDGAHDMGQWTAMHMDTSHWRASRWIAAGRALPELPAVSHAFERGEIGIDKVAELTRFASFEDEDAYLDWARDVSLAAIRRRGDLEARARRDEPDVERERWVAWRYFDDSRRFALEAELPAAEGAVIAKTLERMGDQIPAMPDEDSPLMVGARRADALVALCSEGATADEGGDRATVVVHAQWETLLDGDAAAQIEGGPAIDGAAARRLLCNARMQTVIEDADGSVLGLGRLAREPSAWMLRQLRYRDDACRFPGCGRQRFTQAHHIVWWSRGGKTDLDNLVLICSFHHRLVHEHRWRIERGADGQIAWYRPSGVRYRAGPLAA